MIIWFIGMSGSGKTTLSRALYEHLKPSHTNMVLLDGDDFREIFRNDVDHSVEGRRKNAERISHFCRVMDLQGIHVIASVLSIFPDWQSWNRETFSSYYEVFLDMPLEALEARDTKGLYAAAREGRMDNMVGYDITFPRPTNADLILGEADQNAGVYKCLDTVLSAIPDLS